MLLICGWILFSLPFWFAASRQKKRMYARGWQEWLLSSVVRTRGSSFTSFQIIKERVEGLELVRPNPK